MYKTEGLQIICTEDERYIIDEAVKQYHLYKGHLDVVVYIGAHVGTVSLLAAKYGAKHVLAFEPVFENFISLVENIRLNNFYKSITPIKMAVSGKTGFVNLYSGKHLNSGQNSLVYKKANFEIIEAVPALTLHTILSFFNKVSYLKIDVEGAEFDILLNTRKEDMHKVEYLDLEIHDPSNSAYFEDNEYSTDSLEDHINNCGFDSKNSLIRIR